MTARADTSKLPDDLLVEFGQRVRIVRNAAHLTQRQLATRVRLRSPGSITFLEDGKCQRLNTELLFELVELARQAGKDANWLLCGEPPQMAQPETLAELAARALADTARIARMVSRC